MRGPLCRACLLPWWSLSKAIAVGVKDSLSKECDPPLGKVQERDGLRQERGERLALVSWRRESWASTLGYGQRIFWICLRLILEWE
jgi:hypothetical protein